MDRTKGARRVTYVVAGPAGSGKSTLGRALAEVTGSVLLDQDVATNPLMAQLAVLVGAGADLDHPGLRGPVRTARYRCLTDIAVDNRRIGNDVVMVAPFTSECSDPHAWAELARQLEPSVVHLIWVTVPPEVAMARRQQRNLARDRSAVGVGVPAPTPAPVVAHLAASGSVAAAIEAARIVRCTEGG